MLLPVTTWTDKDSLVKVKPTLIYHQESETVFDADSMISFLRDYKPDYVTILGTPPQELADLLVASPNMGAGLKQNEISVIDLSELSTFWQSVPTVVVSQDDYETAMHAAVFASHRNMPLVIEGTALDTSGTYKDKYVVCVGDAKPEGATCRTTYDLQLIQEAYIKEIQTNKVVYTNPSDLSTYQSYTLYPDTSASPFTKLYTKTSLVAPYLAAAKKQMLATNTSTSYEFPPQNQNNLYAF